jgi:hypothetical protein
MPEFIPLHANVHFKCAFDIVGRNPATIMTHLRKIVREWCLSKAGRNSEELHRAWFYMGNNPRVDPHQFVIGDFRIRTAAAPSDNPDEPSCPAFEMIHLDHEEIARRWSVEITLRRNEDATIRFTTVVHNWMIQNYIGEYPIPPAASAPRYVRTLLTDRSLTCTKGDAPLKANVINITNTNCRDVYEQLLSASRQLPFVFVSHSAEGVVERIDNLAATLIGNANVFLLQSESVVDEMNYHLGDALRCESGSIRVYQPRVDKSDPANPRLHRFLSSSHILQHGYDGILRFLTNGLARNGSSFRPNDLNSITDIFTERRRHAIKKLALQTQSKSNEAEMVWEEFEKVSRDAAEWESTAGQYAAENDEIKKELSALKSRVDEADRVRNRIRELESQINAVQNLSTFPTSLADILITISHLFPTRVEIASDALESAEEYVDLHDGYWRKTDQLAIAWEMVFGVATKLYDLFFVHEPKNLEEEFDQASKFSLAMSEGKQTKKNAELMSLRKIVHKGKELDITPHIKYGNRLPKLLRLHFAVNREDKVLIVGHFGEHLENSTSRKIR